MKPLFSNGSQWSAASVRLYPRETARHSSLCKRESPLPLPVVTLRSRGPCHLPGRQKITLGDLDILFLFLTVAVQLSSSLTGFLIAKSIPPEAASLLCLGGCLCSEDSGVNPLSIPASVLMQAPPPWLPCQPARGPCTPSRLWTHLMKIKLHLHSSLSETTGVPSLWFPYLLLYVAACLCIFGRKAYHLVWGCVHISGSLGVSAVTPWQPG